MNVTKWYCCLRDDTVGRSIEWIIAFATSKHYFNTTYQFIWTYLFIAKPDMPTKVLNPTSSTLHNTAHSSFRQVYTNACQSNKSFPLPSILNSQFDRSLELSFLGDKIQSELEWQLIIHALNEAKDLKGVVIWSTWLHESTFKFWFTVKGFLSPATLTMLIGQ